MRQKLFTKEEKDAVETVLNMGIILTNSLGDELKSDGMDIEIRDVNFNTKEYKNISTALTQFLKEK